LDHVGTGYNSLTGDRTAPLFEWSVPPWYKPSYDSGRYNYDNKIPEQIILTSVASGEGGMITELYESFDQFQSKQQFSMGIKFSAFGASNALSLSKTSERFRSSFTNYQIGVSKQQYKLYELEVKPEIFGYCPYQEPMLVLISYFYFYKCNYDYHHHHHHHHHHHLTLHHLFSFVFIILVLQLKKLIWKIQLQQDRHRQMALLLNGQKTM
jgi:hypothetical protein